MLELDRTVELLKALQKQDLTKFLQQRVEQIQQCAPIEARPLTRYPSRVHRAA